MELQFRDVSTGPLQAKGYDIAPQVPRFILADRKLTRMLRKIVRRVYSARMSGYFTSANVAQLGYALTECRNPKEVKTFLKTCLSVRDNDIVPSFTSSHAQSFLHQLGYWVSNRLRIDRQQARLPASTSRPLGGEGLKAELARANKLVYDLPPNRWTKSSSWVLPFVASKKFPMGECYGIEIEFLIACDNNRNKSRIELEDDYGSEWDADYTDDGGSHFEQEDVTEACPGASLRGDGSVCPDRDDREVTNNYGGDEIGVVINRGDTKRLFALCEFLRRHGATANKSCGLHVHLDCRDTDRSGALGRARRLAAALPWLATIQPESRRGNGYCKLEMSESDRYCAVNFTAFDEHQTVEVRLGAGTVDPTKILNWAETLYFVSRNYHYLRSWSDWQASKAPEHLKNWTSNRRAQFWGDKAEDYAIRS